MITDFFADVNNGQADRDKNVELTTNNALQLYVRTLGGKTLVGSHSVVKPIGYDIYTSRIIYELKGQRRGMSSFWVGSDMEVSAEFMFTSNWKVNIFETRLTFHNAYVVPVPSGFCENVDQL
jgi:hypothetical protein